MEAQPPVADVYGRQSKHKDRSIGQQLEIGQRRVDSENWALGEVLQDGVSASRHATKKRDDWPKLLERVESGKTNVVWLWESTRGDRRASSWLLFLELCQGRDVMIYVETYGRLLDPNNPRDWRTLAEDGTDGQYESEKIRERILRDVNARAEAGTPHGKIGYGWMRDYDPKTRRLIRQIEHPEQAEIVREMARRTLAGESNYAVAKDLNERGVHGPRTEEWDPTTVRRILINPSYAGLRVHRGKVVGKADWPAILDEADHHRLVARLTDPTRTTYRDRSLKHLLSGIARCGQRLDDGEYCDNKVRRRKNASRRKTERGATNYRYGAYMAIPCFHVARKQEWVDELVAEYAVERLKEINEGYRIFRPDDKDEFEQARKHLADLQAELDGWYDAGAAGRLTPAGLEKIESKLLQRIKAAEEAARPKIELPTVADEVQGEDAREVWDELDIAIRREIVDTLMIVRILPSTTRRAFDPATVDIQWR